MSWYTLLNEMLDMRTFSNLWFWIALAVIWSMASHWVLGVPYDMVVRADRNGEEAEDDLRDLVRVNINRITGIVDAAGLSLIAFGTFMMSSFVVLGWVYDLQFGQAMTLIFGPMSVVWMLSIRTAYWLRDHATDMETVRRRLRRLRVWTQAIGMVSIFFTSLWGIYSIFSYQLDERHLKPLGQLPYHHAEPQDPDHGRRA